MENMIQTLWSCFLGFSRERLPADNDRLRRYRSSVCNCDTRTVAPPTLRLRSILHLDVKKGGTTGNFFTADPSLEI
uniref:Uncharacterized protein n=1 Tax=Parascaris equorum TaxID=6256 RepID=A0A914RWN3_PAREQ